MNEKRDEDVVEDRRVILTFLSRMLEFFASSGWGQPGSITEFDASGTYRHQVNNGELSPLTFIRSFCPSVGADALMVHWEYFPPAEKIAAQTDAGIYRALMWVDKTGNSTALFCGDDPASWVMAPVAFSRELDLLEELFWGYKAPLSEEGGPK